MSTFSDLNKLAFFATVPLRLSAIWCNSCRSSSGVEYVNVGGHLIMTSWLWK